MSYRVAELFVAPQGEGAMTGQPMAFVRFTACNLRCNGAWVDGAYQPVCDTEFDVHGQAMTEDEIASWAVSTGQPWVLLTGGEPALQVDQDLVCALRCAGLLVAIETNGTRSLPVDIDHITVSPKTAEHTLVITRASELRYVRAKGQHLPRPRIDAEHYFISPAWESDGTLSHDNLNWAIGLCTKNPPWKLSIQTHKLLSVR